MAIKKAFLKTDEKNVYGIDFPDCYFKIEECLSDPVTDRVRISVRAYHNEESRQQAAGHGIYKKVVDCTLSDLKAKKFDYDSILTAAYEYIKTLPEFEDGENV
jgi:hypothetical protein